MKTFKTYVGLLVLLGSFILLSCDKNNDFNRRYDVQIDGLADSLMLVLLNQLDLSDYFPLHTSDYWIYDNMPDRDIDLELSIEGKIYYRMCGSWDTVLYRNDNAGNIYARNDINNEMLKYDFNAEVGDTWQFPWKYSEDGDLFDYLVTLQSKTDSIVLDNIILTQCYRYLFDDVAWADEEVYVWLAPGIGVVEEMYPGGSSARKILDEVNINGVVIDL